MSEVKNIPEGWKETTLGSIILLVGGGTPKTTNDEFWNGEIPWLSVVDFNNDNRWVLETEKSITELGLKNSSTKLLEENDLIISARGTVGALAQLSRTMAFNQSCYGIKEVAGVSDINYLFYLVKYSIQQISRNVHGAVFDTITRQTFDFIDIVYPLDINEQRAIANILTSLDDKIALLQAQNKTLEATAQTIFKEWFGKYQVGDELPEGWRVGTLGEITTKISKGTTPRRGDVEGLEKSVPFLKVKDINNDGLISDSSLELIPETIHLNQLKRSILQTNDILFSIAGTIGRVAKLRKSLNNSNCNQAIAFIRLKDKRNYLNYVYLWLASDVLQAEIVSNIVQGVQANVSLTVLANLRIIIPSQLRMDMWNDYSSPVFDKINLNNNQIQTLTRTRDTLLPKLMSGEVRV